MFRSYLWEVLPVLFIGLLLYGVVSAVCYAETQLTGRPATLTLNFIAGSWCGGIAILVTIRLQRAGML